MPVQDLGEYDVQGVSGNPFAGGDSPDNYDVQPVDHDPFAGQGTQMAEGLGGLLGATSLGVFAGPFAATANLDALNQAQTMAGKGASANKIWGQTGWWQGPEGAWRYEIPDYGAEFDARAGNILGDVLHHPDLYAAYPELAHIGIDHYPGGGAKFSPPQAGNPHGEIAFGYSAKYGQPTLSSALHETQHAIQDISEGTAPGGMPPRDFTPQSPAWSFIEKNLLKGNPGKLPYAEFVKRGTGGAFDYLTQFPAEKIEKAMKQGVFDYYQSLAGEAEARNVEQRYKMGPLLSRITPPWSPMSQDIPYKKQTVKEPWNPKLASRPLPMTPPQVVMRPPSGLMGQEEEAERQREGLEPPGEWTGGRIGRASGGGFDDDDEDLQEAMYDRPSIHDTGPVDVMSPAEMYSRRNEPWRFRPSYAEGQVQAPTQWDALNRLGHSWEGQTPSPPRGAVTSGDAQNLWNPARPWQHPDWIPKVYYQRDLASGGPVELNDALRRRLALLMQPRHGFAKGGGLESEEEELQHQRESGMGADTGIDTPFRARSPGFFSPTRQPQQETSSYSPSWWTPQPKAAAPEPAKLSTQTESLPMIGHNKGPAIEQPLANQALPSFNDPNFPEGRIATSVPTSVANAPTAHANNNLKIGMDLARENPETFKKNADIIRGYDFLRLPEGASDEQAHEALIRHATNNLLALHDAVHPDIRPTSSLWYDGANVINNQMAAEYGRRPENMAGLIAALSPQRDWFMNVENARRVADVLYHQRDNPVSAQMEQWGRDYANRRSPTGRVTPDQVHTAIDEMIGRPLSEMSAKQKAFYVRMYDAAHGPHPSRVPTDENGTPHPEGYPILNPDGSSTGRVAKTKDKEVKKLTWGSTDQLANAIRAYEADNMSDISRAMGNRHKVRNFYNNNAAPNSANGDTTIDTHAIAASLMRPLGASSIEVEHGLGMKGSKNGANGSSGLYPNYFEAYRRAAAARGILPRQMQSITWEALRGLFSPQQKSDPALAQRVDRIWRLYKRGRLSMRNAQQQIMYDQTTGVLNITPPPWKTGSDVVEDEEGE